MSILAKEICHYSVLSLTFLCTSISFQKSFDLLAVALDPSSLTHMFVCIVWSCRLCSVAPSAGRRSGVWLTRWRGMHGMRRAAALVPLTGDRCPSAAPTRPGSLSFCKHRCLVMSLAYSWLDNRTGRIYLYCCTVFICQTFTSQSWSLYVVQLLLPL